MGGDVFGNAGEFSVFLDNAFDGAGGEAAVISVSGGDAEVFTVVEEEGGERIGASGEIVGNFVGGRFGDEDGAVFAAFAANHEFAAIKVDVVPV